MARNISKNRFAVIVLSLLILLVLGRVGFNQFTLYDDPIYVTTNPNVKAGLSFTTVKWAFTSIEAANWHPFTWILHMLDVELFGMSPSGHHLVSLILHLGTTLLLFRFLHLCTGAFWRSILVAALFGIHPLHVESVAWVAERKDVLSGLLWMAGLLAYAGYCRKGGGTRYLLVLCLFALGLMAKPMVVTFPFVLLLLDFWPLKRIEWGKAACPGRDRPSVPPPAPSFSQVMLEKGPMFALAAGSCVITYIAQSGAGAVSAVTHVPIDARILNAFISYLMYLWNLVVPADLSVLYLYPDRVNTPFGILAILSISACTWACLRLSRSAPWFTMGWLWYLGMLVPVIGIVQVGAQSMADRYMYLPSVGILLVLVWGGAWLFQRVGIRDPAGVVIVSAVVCIYALAAHDQVRYWKDTETLFRHALRLNPGNFVAHDMLGLALAEKGNPDAALEHHRTAVDLNPRFVNGLNNLGFALMNKGRLDEGIIRLEKALELEPGHLYARANLARAFLERGDPQDALGHVQFLVSRNQDSSHAHNAAGVVLAGLKRYEEAHRHFSKALALCPQSPDVENNFGRFLMLVGRPGDAIGHLEKALEMQEVYPEAHNNIALCLLAMGKPRDAVYHAARAVHLKPDYEKALRTLDRVVEAFCAHPTPVGTGMMSSE